MTHDISLPPTKPDDFLSRLREGIEFVEQRVVNREPVIEQIFAALLTREHALVQSRTGAGKSLLAEQIFLMFEGANLFTVQASKDQQPDTYFGGLDIEELKKGRLIHNTEGSLVESEFGFIDEIFDANDYTLRSLLSCLNERALRRGVQYVKARIHTVIAATNYLRISEITEALLDRFLYKSLVIPDKEPYVQYQISRRYFEYGGSPVEPPFKIPYAQLYWASEKIKGNIPGEEISIPTDVMYFANLVVRYYESLRNRRLKEHPEEYPHLKDFYISPRTQAKAIDLLSAIAFLQGRDDVRRDDVEKLYFIFTTIGIEEEKSLFRKAYQTVLHQYNTRAGFTNLKALLELDELLERLRLNPELLKKPITELEHAPLKKTLLEWAKEKLGLVDPGVEHNRRLLESFSESITPMNEETHELKQYIRKSINRLFQSREHIWGQ